MRKLALVGGLTFTLAVCFGCFEASPAKAVKAATPSAAAADDAAAGWGAVKGQIVWGGAALPEVAKLEIEKDADHCLSKGPILSEAWAVNPKNKGVQHVVVFLKPEKGKPLPINDSLKSQLPDVVMDQPCCKFEPHVVAMRVGQKLVAKNSSPKSHNTDLKGFVNSYNKLIPAGKEFVFDSLEMEPSAIQVKCGIHPWMTGWLWVFDHPYFAVTDADGNFEIKIAPAGARNLVVWQETMGWLGGKDGRNGKPITVNPSGVTDLGKIELKPN